MSAFIHSFLAFQGAKPAFVNATAGTTVLGSYDDFNKIADVCEKYGVWLHVDVRHTELNFVFTSNNIL